MLMHFPFHYARISNLLILLAYLHLLEEARTATGVRIWIALFRRGQFTAAFYVANASASRRIPFRISSGFSRE